MRARRPAHCFEGPVDGAGSLAHPLLALEQVSEPEEIERRRAWAARCLEQVTREGTPGGPSAPAKSSVLTGTRWTAQRDGLTSSERTTLISLVKKLGQSADQLAQG